MTEIEKVRKAAHAANVRLDKLVRRLEQVDTVEEIRQAAAADQEE